jgi:cobalt-zinc-cadmium efflux system outer membrane protein
MVMMYQDKYREIAKKDRDIADYAYHRGGLTLLDFLDAERTYRSEELGYRQTLASYLLAMEELREAVGVRNLQ